MQATKHIFLISVSDYKMKYSGLFLLTLVKLQFHFYREMVGSNRYGISMVAGLITVLLGFGIMLLVNVLQRERGSRHE